jgi:prefoldin subunit 5
MESEKNTNINVEEIKRDIEKYQKDLSAIQDEINKIEARNKKW